MTNDGFKNNNGRVATGIGRCVCGKVMYTSRKLAKKAARMYSHHDLTAYQCGEFWHLGHLPPVIARGHVPRDNATRSYQ